MMGSIVDVVRDASYTDTKDVAATLNPDDAGRLISYCGSRVSDIDLFDKLFVLLCRNHASSTEFTQAEMRAIQEALHKTDRGAW
jgi:hypothetical protein